MEEFFGRILFTYKLIMYNLWDSLNPCNTTQIQIIWFYSHYFRPLHYLQQNKTLLLKFIFYFVKYSMEFSSNQWPENLELYL